MINVTLPANPFRVGLLNLVEIEVLQYLNFFQGFFLSLLLSFILYSGENLCPMPFSVYFIVQADVVGIAQFWGKVKILETCKYKKKKKLALVEPVVEFVIFTHLTKVFSWFFLLLPSLLYGPSNLFIFFKS